MITFADKQFAKSDSLGLRTDGFMEQGSFQSFLSSILAGKDVVDELERDFKSDGVTKPRKGSAAWMHGKFNKRREGVAELSQMALRAVEGYKAFKKGTKNETDFAIVNEVTEDCYSNYMNLERECREREERGEDKYRTFDGTCNNILEVKLTLYWSKAISL